MAIPITRPVMGESELSAIGAVLESGYLVQGIRVAEFERLVARHVGTAHAVAVSNCTSALRVALLALGTRQGDRVIVAPYSWVATANVIELCGAVPVFVDIDPATFNMDPGLLKERLELLSASGEIGSVRAIMPVHTFGSPAGISELVNVAAAYSIPLIEDAACALGASENARPAGSFGSIGCFSFHPRKIITTGEGGMIVTDDNRVAEFARTFRNHGQQLVDGSVEFVMAGDNLRLTDLQGAIGVAQMARLVGLVEVRSHVFNCPVYRSNEKAKIAERNDYQDAAGCEKVRDKLSKAIFRFDAAHECKEVTCLYNSTNWWLQELVDHPEKLVHRKLGKRGCPDR